MKNSKWEPDGLMWCHEKQQMVRNPAVFKAAPATPPDAPKGEPTAEPANFGEQLRRSAGMPYQPSPTMADAKLTRILDTAFDNKRPDAIVAKATLAAGEPTDERAAFEAHMLGKYGSKPLTWIEAEGGPYNVPEGMQSHYYIRSTQEAWEAWQTRASLALRASSAGTPHGAREPSEDAKDAARVPMSLQDKQHAYSTATLGAIRSTVHATGFTEGIAAAEVFHGIGQSGEASNGRKGK